MRPGDGPFVWYLIKGVPPVPEVIGVYSERPPEGCGDTIRSVQVANIGAVPLLTKATRIRDRVFDAVSHLLP